MGLVRIEVIEPAHITVNCQIQGRYGIRLTSYEPRYDPLACAQRG